MAITVSWTMRQFYDCVACDILMDKVTLNKIQVCCKFFFFFQFSHAELSCEIYVYCLLGDHTYLPGLKLRKVIKVRGKGAMKVITTL